MSKDLNIEIGQFDPYMRLILRASVTESDVENAVKKWKKNPPLPGVTNLLSAKIKT